MIRTVKRVRWPKVFLLGFLLGIFLGLLALLLLQHWQKQHKPTVRKRLSVTVCLPAAVLERGGGSFGEIPEEHFY